MGGGKRKERKRTHAIKCQRQKLLRTRNILQREKKKEKNTFVLPLFLSKSRRKTGMKNGEGKIREREKERGERVCECVSGIVQEDDNVSTMVHG